MSPPVHTREAKVDDHTVFVHLFPELDIDDPLPSREHFAKSIAPTAIIAEMDGKPAGYGHYRELADVGHVVHLIVDPDYRRQGVAHALMKGIAERLRALGLSRWRLNVKTTNTPALSLYRGFGLKPQYESVVIRFSWELVSSFPEASGALVAAVPASDDDAEIESRFSIPSGMLPARRLNANYLLLGVQEAGRWVGIAAFSPSHPGAFPFKVERPELATFLLRSLRVHAEKPTMQIVAEADPALADYLIGRGAVDHMRILNLEGALE